MSELEGDGALTIRRGACALPIPAPFQIESFVPFRYQSGTSALVSSRDARTNLVLGGKPRRFSAAAVSAASSGVRLREQTRKRIPTLTKFVFPGGV